MTRRLATAVALYSHEVEHHRTAADVIERVHQIARGEAGLSLYGIWRLAEDPADMRKLAENRHVFIHPDAPQQYRPEHLRETQRYGLNALSRLAARQPLPFTFRECSRAITPKRSKPDRGDLWVFDLMQRHGMRDGVYCPVGRWRVMFYSSRVLELPFPVAARGLLHTLSSLAVSKMDRLTRRNGQRLEAPGPPLSARELSVLQGLAMGSRISTVASSLDISESSARTFLRRAMKKLKAKTHAHAVLIAMRRSLIQ